MKLSIIVPVYNTRNQLSRCLDSILKQQMSDMEIICVDDGSTDGSGELLDQYAFQDSRIRVIHKKNEGLVCARKVGVEVAKGEYIGYVDSDDWIDPEMYEMLCHVAEHYEADMVSSGFIHEKNISVKFYDGFPDGLYVDQKLDALREQIFFCESNRTIGIRSSLCNKLFRTSILKKVQYMVPDEVSNCEDRLCTVAYILEAKSVYILKEAFYHYVFHNSSMFHKEDTCYFDKLGKVYRAFRSLYGHPNFSERLRNQCELYIIKMALDGLNEHMGLTPDLMWINPRWIERFPLNSEIVLYGAGRLGKVYYRQIVADPMKRIRISGWIDVNYQHLTEYPEKISSPESLRMMKYDYVLLALVDEQPAKEVRRQLIDEFGVDEKKIIWLRQQEIFWEYAEASGMLKE